MDNVQLKDLQSVLNMKYPNAIVQEALPNGDILIKIGGSMSRVPAKEFAQMVQSKAHRDERPEEIKLDAFTQNAILIEKMGYADAQNHPKFTKMVGDLPSSSRDEPKLPSEM